MLTLMILCFSIVSVAANITLSMLRGLLDSGHGGQTKDLDGDEDDGYDEGKHRAAVYEFKP